MKERGTTPNIDTRAAATRDIFDAPITVLSGVIPYDDKRGGVGYNYSVAARHVCPLGRFLRPVQSGTFADDVKGARDTMTAAIEAWNVGDRRKYDALLNEYNKRKAVPPMAIIGGVCPANNSEGFISYSDVVCIDIDMEKPHKGTNGNEWMRSVDLEWLKHQVIGKLPFVAYCALSAGGRGLFALIPYASHESHEGHFRALQRIFKTRMGITLDEGAKDIVRKRYMSHDPHPYVNRNATIFTAVDALPSIPSATPQADDDTAATHEEDEKHVIMCVKEIAEKGIDITANYHTWVTAAASLAHTFGESGWPYFETVSSQSHQYNEKKNKRLWHDVQKSKGNQCSLATFFWLCSANGVTYADKLVKRKTQPQPIPTPRLRRVQPTAAAIQSEKVVLLSSHPMTDDEAPQEPTQPLVMTPAEAADLESMTPAICAQRDKLWMMRRASPAIDDLCGRLALDIEGVTDDDGLIWSMTPAQWEHVYGRDAPF